MNYYANRGGNSNVKGYEIGEDFITVYFKKSSKAYTYSYRSCGSSHVEKMKLLAKGGQGLNGYIKSNVDDDFEK